MKVEWVTVSFEHPLFGKRELKAASIEFGKPEVSEKEYRSPIERTGRLTLTIRNLERSSFSAPSIDFESSEDLWEKDMDFIERIDHIQKALRGATERNPDLPAILGAVTGFGEKRIRAITAGEHPTFVELTVLEAHENADL